MFTQQLSQHIPFLGIPGKSGTGASLGRSISVDPASPRLHHLSPISRDPASILAGTPVADPGSLVPRPYFFLLLSLFNR